MFQRRLEILFLLALLLVPAGAGANPYLPVFEGGTHPGLVTVFSPISFYVNPGAMALMDGGLVYASFTPSIGYATVSRKSIDPSTGRPGGSLPFPAVDVSQNNDYFLVALGQNFGKVVTGLALFTPYSISSSSSSQGPLRYHLVDNDVMNLMVTPAVSLRLHRKFMVGFGVGYVFTRIRRSFMRDLRLRGESPEGDDAPFEEGGTSDEEVRLDVEENSFVFFGGLIWRPKKWLTLGLSYRSRIRALDRSNIQAAGSVEVNRWFEEDGWQTISGRAKLLTSFPDSLTLGGLFTLSKTLKLDLSLTWTRWGALDKERYLLTGSEFGAMGYSNWDVFFSRAVRMQDTLEPQVSVLWSMSRDFSLDATLKFSPPAMKRSWVSPIFIDGYTISSLIHGTMRIGHGVSLDVGYSLSYMVPWDAGDGFDPYAAQECLDSHLDVVWNEGCVMVNDGMALPSASARYERIVHQLGAGISYSF